MKDLHSHFLYNVDDGSKSLESTLFMLKNAKDNGVLDIVFTPHYIANTQFSSPKDNNIEIFNAVHEIADYMGINIYLGNEVFCDPDILKYLKEGKISTINNSKYLLVEIPMNSKMNNAKNIFFELISNGITPILAHPERYTAYYNDMQFFYDLRTMGVLMQINFSSLVGGYGERAKRVAKELLKYNLVSFVGSDVHSEKDHRYDDVAKAMKIIKRIVGNERFLDITERNFDKVINNKDI